MGPISIDGRLIRVAAFVGLICAAGFNSAYGQVLTSQDNKQSPEESFAQSAADWLAELKRKWPELEKKLNTQIPLACAGPSVPAANLNPRIVFQSEAVVDFAASPTGVVAVADLSKGQVHLFPHGIDQEDVPLTPLGGLFGPGSMRLSNDGRYLAWSGGFRDHIVDVAERREISRLDFEVAGQQWIGDDLLIEPLDFPGLTPSPRSNSLLLMKRDGSGFRETALTTQLFPVNSHGLPDVVHSFDREAKADQLGQSFISAQKVYHTASDALADGAIPLPYPLAFELRTFRLGNFLLRVNVFQTREEMRDHKQPTWSLNLLSGESGQKLSSRTLPQPWCKPNDIAVAADGKSFAMLIGAETIIVVDSSDLAYRSVYNLLSPPGTMPIERRIALLPDGRILVTTDTALIAYDPRSPE